MKCIELRGEYVEYILSLVAVACLLPGRAKDLSAPPPTYPKWSRLCTDDCGSIAGHVVYTAQLYVLPAWLQNKCYEQR
jgi:hypothetical protein